MIKKSFQAGFTLIEMIVSLALFSVVVTISVGALLVLIATNQQLQNEQSVMTNLSFALDSMTREIRTGVNYYCNSHPNTNAGGGPNSMFNPAGDLDAVLGNNTNDCSAGNTANHRLQGVSFIEGGDSITGSAGRILYYFDRDVGRLFRRVGSGAAQSIVSSGIYITDAEFFVSGSQPLEAGGALSQDQSLVTIYLQARDSNDPSAKRYEIQTTVTQRTLDI